MAFTTERPAVLIVHDAWHNPSPRYTPLINYLREAGFLASCPMLPSVTSPHNKSKPRSLADDVATIYREATMLVNWGHPVLVVCHSYGGIVATNALTPELSFSERQKQGKAGGIVGILYVCAFMPKIGQSFMDCWGKGYNDKRRVSCDDAGLLRPDNPTEEFFGDLNEEDAERMMDALVPHLLDAQTSRTTHEAWRNFPVSYVICEDDQVVTSEVQREMLRVVREEGVIVKCWTLKTAHSPMLSMPEQMLRVVKQAWNESVEWEMCDMTAYCTHSEHIE
ncbi:MAG: hypothetical protein M1820_008397 [Bogoriella megaspora]|nr:MAG: hypothetical protein M1820_008397 [Bogoriella megaspora]